MSDGELKQRIKYEGGGGDPQFQWIFEILDEAKKEFPTCSTCKFYLKDKDTCPFSALGEDCCPKTDWFKKWFGDTKQ